MKDIFKFADCLNRNLWLISMGITCLFMISGCDPMPGAVTFYEMDVPQKMVSEIENLKLQPSAKEPNLLTKLPERSPETLELTLEQCRAIAMENNLEIKVQLYDPKIAAETVSQQEANFESTFSLGINEDRTDSPPATDLFVVPSQSENTRFNGGVSIPLQTGGTISLGLRDSRYRSNRESDFYDPSFSTAMGFSISQPLLRGAGRRANMHSIRVARYSLTESMAATKLKIIDIIGSIDSAYWQYVAAIKELDVRKKQFELARAQLDRAQRLVEAGQRSEVEVIRAEAGTSSQLEAIIIAETTLRNRHRELKRILNSAGLSVDSVTRLIPKTELDPVHYELDPDHLISQALEHRMELLQLELQLATNVSNIDSLRNLALPKADLNYSFYINGVGGSRSGSYNLLFDNKYADNSLGISFEIPLGNEAAKSKVRQAIYQRLQLLASKENREKLIKRDVLNAIDLVHANWQRILAGRQNVVLEARLVDAEIRQFEIGMRTSTDVLEAQTRLADAQSTEINALKEYQISLVELAYATGTLLGQAKVDWQPYENRL